MYPELYPELEGKDRKIKGFALSLVGSFMFMVTTVGTIAYSSQWAYLGISLFSLGAISLVFLAHRSQKFLGQVTMLIAASATLATETGVVGFVFPTPLAAATAVFTLAGSLIAARGIHDVESMVSLDPFTTKRRREVAIEQRAGGE
jgi:hypothetical protein